MRNLYIVGTVPASSFTGGVSIHVKRLLDAMDAHMVSYQFVDYKKIGVKKALLFLITHKGVVHIHATHPVLILMFILTSKAIGSTCILTLHADYDRFDSWKKLFVKIALRLADVPILINKRTFLKFKSANTNSLLIPAFIPPYKEIDLQKCITKKIQELKDKGLTIVSTNASRLSFDKHGNEIYGITFLTKYFKDKNEYALVISDPQGVYKQRIREIGENIVFIDFSHSYFPLLKLVDIFVRNTSTDGDALSVKESLFLGKTTLCTDAVDRPNGVLLFSYNDEASFSKAMTVAKEMLGCNHKHNIQDGAIEIIRLYQKMTTV